MRDHGGSVINMASVAGIRPEPLTGAYNASKAALITLTARWPASWGRSASASTRSRRSRRDKLARYLVETTEVHEHIIGQTALGRHAVPDEIAGAALFLASDAATFVTGRCSSWMGAGRRNRTSRRREWQNRTRQREHRRVDTMANDQGLGFTLSRRAALSPKNTALVFRDERWTYSELNHLTNRVAHGLHALGVNPGDRVGFLGLNHPRFFFTMFATAKLDAIFVPLNFRLTGKELSFIIRDAGLHTLVYEEAFASIVEAIRADLMCANTSAQSSRAARVASTSFCTISATTISTRRWRWTTSR